MAHLHVKTPRGTTYSIDLDAANSSGGSSSENRWLKLLNGCIIQWGRLQGTETQNCIITFPIAFSSVCHFVSAHLEDSAYNEFGSVFDSPHSMTKTDFQVWTFNSAPFATQWFAIGQ